MSNTSITNDVRGCIYFRLSNHHQCHASFSEVWDNCKCVNPCSV